jgi:hypothetical protein
MMRAGRKVWRGVTDGIILIACLLFPVIAVGQPGQPGQSSDSKPPPATKDQTQPDAKSGKSRPAPPEGRERPRSGERIRRDAPVSFPVDI